MSGLADTLRDGTRSLHVEAERSGVIRAILRREADIHRYTLLLRNLWTVYVALERGLDRHRRTPGVSLIALPEIYRAPAIEADLNVLCGSSWRQRLALLPAAERYANRVATAGDGEGTRLIGHAYTRYLGDLNGGQIVRQLLTSSLGLDQQSLNFYAFPGISNMDQFRADYRQAYDRAGHAIGHIDQVVDEAKIAFQHNIELSEAVEKTVLEKDAAD